MTKRRTKPTATPGDAHAAPLALLTVADVATRLSLSTRTVSRLISDRKLAGKKFGRTTRITAASVHAFVDGLPDITGPDALFPERRP